MRRLVLAALALLASSSAAQGVGHGGAPPGHGGVPPGHARGAPPPRAPAAAPAAPPQAAPAAQPPAPAQPAARQSSNTKALERLKAFGRVELQKTAPRLGPAEKLVRKKGDTLVDRAVDLAAEQAGAAPAK